MAVSSPVKTYIWLDKGFYNAGQNIGANFANININRKPVPGTLEVECDNDYECIMIQDFTLLALLQAFLAASSKKILLRTTLK